MKETSASNNTIGYKPFIKNISIEQVPPDRKKSTDLTNKTFFSNIKAELNSIRTDVNKLVTKDSAKPLNVNKSYNVNPSSTAPPKSDSSNSNAEKSVQLNIQKRLFIEPSNEKYAPNSAMLQTKLFKALNQLSQQTIKYEQVKTQLEEVRKSQNNLRDQVARLKQFSSKLDHECSSKEKQINNLKSLLASFQKDKQQIMKTINHLQGELQKKQTKIEKTVPQDNLALGFDNGKIKFLEQQNARLMRQLKEFDSKKQQQIGSILKNCQQKIHRAEAKSYKQLGAGFQVKINELLDENYSLKNKITLLESQIEQQRVKIQSLSSTVQAYEARDREVGKGANQLQLQNLRNKVMQLQDEMDKMQSQHEYEIMKLQNEIDELRSSGGNKNDNKSFNQVLKDQINEIENLKQKLREKNEIINKLKK